MSETGALGPWEQEEGWRGKPKQAGLLVAPEEEGRRDGRSFETQVGNQALGRRGGPPGPFRPAMEMESEVG